MLRWLSLSWFAWLVEAYLLGFDGGRGLVAMGRVFFFVIILLGLFASVCLAKTKFSVLVIHSYHQGLSWTDSQMRGIYNNLNSGDFEIYVEYLDAKRFKGNKFFTKKTEAIIEKYQDKIDIDLVVVTDDYALIYVIESKKYSQFFVNIPIVFSGVNFYHDSIKQNYPNITGVVESFDLLATVDAVLRIQSGVERITVINDQTVTGHQNVAHINAMANYFKEEVAFVVHSNYSADELAKNLSTLTYPQDAVLLLSMNRDNTGKYFEFEEASRFVASVCNVPIYGVWDFYLNNGLIGGKITSGYEQGKSVANLIKKILVEQIPASRIPVITVSPNKYIFDYVHLNRFGIDVSLLPPGTNILNQPDPFLIRHKAVIRNFFLFIAFQSLVIVILIFVNRIFRKKNIKFYEGSKNLFRGILENATFFDKLKYGFDFNNKSFELFKTVFSKSLVGCIVYNKNFEILDINDTALSIFGHNPNEQAQYANVKQFFNDIPENTLLEGTSEAEYKIKKQGGEHQNCKISFSYIVYGEEILRLAVVKDITIKQEGMLGLKSSKTKIEALYDEAIEELNEANIKLIFAMNEISLKQKELFNTKEKLKKIVDTINSVIVVVNSNGNIIAYNSTAQEFCGCNNTNQTLLNKNFEECYKKYGAKNIHIEQVIKENKSFHINSRYCKVDNKNIFVDLSFFPMPIFSATESEVLVKIDDVTDRVNFQKMMFHSEKMMSVSNLAAGMAHEINNPLGGILQGAQNIERRLSLGLENNIEVAKKYDLSLESLQKYLEERKIFYFLSGIKESGNKVAEIIKSLLRFSLSAGDKKELVNLNEMCFRAVELAKSDYGLKHRFFIEKIDFIQNYQENIREVYCNSNEIELVLLGLIKNSVYAIRKKEKIFGTGDFSPFIKLETQYAESYAHIYIEDNGGGIDENFANRIFEPFFTTNQIGDGMGLGLSVAYSVITHGHQGTIELEKSQENTTVFKISLPYQ